MKANMTSILDYIIKIAMKENGVWLLRVSLGIVFFWFGILKILGVSPVAELVGATYSFMPAREFLLVLGVWEVIIGLGLIFKIAIRTTIGLLLLQMSGTFLSFILAPEIFFNGNFFLLTTEGEFVIKNIVLVSAGIVIGGYESKE